MSNNIRFITRDGEKSLSPSSSTSSLKGLQLKNPISSSYAEEEDTLQLKQGLNKLGYYEVPAYGMTPYADSAMIDSIKKLQQDANLTVDGKVNPDGETLSEINKRLGQKETSFVKDKAERFDKFLHQLTQPGREGSVYEDRPSRIDQPTHSGITQKTWQNFRKSNPETARHFPDHVKDSTFEQRKAIYKKNYYKPYRIEEIQNDRQAAAIYDMSVMSNPNAVAHNVQKALVEQGYKVQEDGIMGSETINALNKANAEGKTGELMTSIKKHRNNYLNTLKNHEKNPGWFRRTNSY